MGARFGGGPGGRGIRIRIGAGLCVLAWALSLSPAASCAAAENADRSRSVGAGTTGANPMCSWADDRTALAARMALGAGLTWMLHRLHSDSPRLARALALVAIVANLVTSGSNEHVSRAARPAVPDR